MEGMREGKGEGREIPCHHIPGNGNTIPIIAGLPPTILINSSCPSLPLMHVRPALAGVRRSVSLSQKLVKNLPAPTTLTFLVTE